MPSSDGTIVVDNDPTADGFKSYVSHLDGNAPFNYFSFATVIK
jgi:hypothetical protein